MKARTLELEEEITTEEGVQRASYQFRMGPGPGAFATASTYPLDGHYLLSGPEGKLDVNVTWLTYPNKSHVFGIEHDFDAAKSRLYRRVRSQARRIARREGLEVEVIRSPIIN